MNMDMVPKDSANQDIDNDLNVCIECECVP